MSSGATAVASLPPWVIGPFSENWSFVAENEMWPLVHTLFPLTVYIYLRDWRIVIFLMYLNESVEALIGAIANDPSKFPPEALTNSLISDILMGVFGMVMGELLLRITDRDRFGYLLNSKFRTNLFPYPVWTAWYFIKYLVQIVILAVPWIFTTWFFADNQFSSGLTAYIPGAPIAIMLWYYWNQEDFVWNGHRSETLVPYVVMPEDEDHHGHPTKHVAFSKHWVNFRQTDAIWRLYRNWAIFVLIYAGSFYYRYTSVFVMSIFHFFVSIVVLTFFI